MILGNAGIVAVIIAATSSFVRSEGHGIALDIVLLAAGVFVISRVAAHRGLIRRWEQYLERTLAALRTLFDEDGSPQDA